MNRNDKDFKRHKAFIDFILSTIQDAETTHERELKKVDYVSNKDLYKKLNAMEKDKVIEAMEELRDEFELDFEKGKKNARKLKINFVACILFAVINIIFLYCGLNGNLITCIDAIIPIVFSIYLSI